MPAPSRILIVGGGPAGIATALRLQHHGFAAITVLEAGDHTAPKIGETLQPPCQHELQELGFWPSFLADAHLPASLTGSAWGSSSVDFRDFLFRPVGRGWHLDRARFDRRLAEFAESRGVTILRHTRLGTSMRRSADWQLELLSPGHPPRLASADFVVDASGRQAVFARAHGAESIHFDELFGCYQFFDLPAATPEAPSHTLVESVPDGWWYSARLPDRRFVAAFMTDGALVRSLRTHEPAGLQRALAASTHTAARLRSLTPLGPPIVTAAHSHLLECPYGDTWLAVGDAAAAYDPLSSMGIHQALRGGLAAGDAIAAHLRGEADALPRYARVLQEFYHRYLETKADFYRAEQRWSGRPFWRARHQQVYLSPHSSLRALPGGATSSLNRHLSARRHDELRRRCALARPAHEVVADFQREHPDRYSDLQVILALQHSIERHRLAVAAEA